MTALASKTFLLVLAAVTGATAQAPDPGAYSPAQFEVVGERGHRVPMRDGVALSVDLYRPATGGPHPAILSLTPYDNATTGSRVQARWFAERGFAVAFVDTRGRFDSDGEWDPFDSRHKTDGYDLVEWLASRDWSNGNVGMIGGSYLGWTQWWTASTVPPSLKAIVPLVAPPDHFENTPYQNGVLQGGWWMDWAAGMAGRTFQTVGDAPYWGWQLSRAQDLMQRPYIEMTRARGMMHAPWFEGWYRNNLSSASYWKGIAYQGQESYSRMTVPSLNVTGWFDANYPGSPMNYMGMRDHGATPEARRPTLIIGPWIHGVNQRIVGGVDYGPEAEIDLLGYHARWFDRHLKGIQNGVENDPPVYVFVMGPNTWRQADDWPLPETEWTSVYLTSDGHANSLKGDGRLLFSRPNEDGVDTYVYDPDHPITAPFTGGHNDGAVDSRLSALGDDVLVYDTEPLQRDVTVVGPIVAKLYAATSAKDTDWMVRLVDVHPDGYAGILTEGVLRARSRDPGSEGRYNSERLSTIEPNEIYEYTIRFWRGTGNVFKVGHRIRIEISSSYYPYYLPNLNTGEDNLALATEPVIATQRVHHGPAYPSHVILPVLPGREPVPEG